MAPAILLFACGGSGDGSASSGVANGGLGPSSGPVTQDRFASSYAESLCAVVDDCCRSNGLGYDRGNCTRASQGIAQAVLNRGLSRGLAYDPMRAGACITFVRTYARACGGGSTDNNPCEGLFIGNKEPGAPCKTSDECRPSSEGEVRCLNWFAMGQSGALCQVVKPVAVGGACTSGSTTPPLTTVFNCEEGQDLYCDAESSSCRSMPKAGEGCSSSCASSAFCKAGRCVARGTVGAACDAGSTDNNAQCIEGTYCDIAGTKTCLSLKPPREACMADAECESRRCANGKCEARSEIDLSLVCGGRA